MVPFAAPPATLQVTAVFDVPVTVAVNCCVFPTDMVTGEGETETAMGVAGLDVPAQPHNAMKRKLRPPRNIRCCMDVLTGGADLRFKNRKSESGHRQSYP